MQRFALHGQSRIGFQCHRIWIQDHPPHSPDLNAIEHVWKQMKEILHKEYGHLINLNNNEHDYAIAEAAIQDAWDKVPQLLIDNLVDSMPRRLLAVRRACGWYTKY